MTATQLKLGEVATVEGRELLAGPFRTAELAAQGADVFERRGVSVEVEGLGTPRGLRFIVVSNDGEDA